MSDKHWTDDKHYRVVSDDGNKSWLYEDTGFFTPDSCVEVADHHSDGTTTAYEYDHSVIGELFFGGRGARK